MDKKISKYVICLLLVLIPVIAAAGNITGKVIKISDGDTLTILDSSKNQIKIRLAEIDTPESRQPYGSKSKEALSKLVFGKTVVVNVQKTDRYGRTVGRVYVNGLSVDAEMVRLGAAWVYRQYATDKSLYEIENKAKDAKLGLWALPEAQRIPPWEWRKAKREGTLTKGKSTKASKCGNKTKCSQMNSCQEALFYLNECGLSRLDRDGDGVPCESLCK